MRPVSLSALALAAFASFLTVVGAARAAGPTTTTWVVDPAHSTAGFSVRHMLVNTVKGQFGKVTGEIVLDDQDPTKGSVSVVIDPSTIDTHEPKRDAHLRSPDFFDVAKFPTVTFKSTKVEKVGRMKLKVTGDLTMHGVTKPVTLNVDGPTPELRDGTGNVSRGATVTGKLNRKDWGLTWNQPFGAAGGVLVSDDVSLDFQVQLHPKK
jgi:polyisoprenoid-binding protein YceI